MYLHRQPPLVHSSPKGRILHEWIHQPRLVEPSIPHHWTAPCHTSWDPMVYPLTGTLPGVSSPPRQ